MRSAAECSVPTRIRKRAACSAMATTTCPNCGALRKRLEEKDAELEQLRTKSCERISSPDSTMQRQLLEERENLTNAIKSLRQEVTKLQIKLLRKDMDVRAERDARRKLLKWVHQKRREQQEAEKLAEQGTAQPFFWINMFKNMPFAVDADTAEEAVFWDEDENEDLVPRCGKPCSQKKRHSAAPATTRNVCSRRHSAPSSSPPIGRRSTAAAAPTTAGQAAATKAEGDTSDSSERSVATTLSVEQAPTKSHRQSSSPTPRDLSETSPQATHALPPPPPVAANGFVSASGGFHSNGQRMQQAWLRTARICTTPPAGHLSTGLPVGQRCVPTATTIPAPQFSVAT